MKIAIPLLDGCVSAHFGHCPEFAMFEVDEAAKKVTAESTVPAPRHEPGLLPRWLAEQGATVVIAGGMGRRAQDLLAEQGIQVVTGAPVETADKVVAAFLCGTLSSGPNACTH